MSGSLLACSLPLLRSRVSPKRGVCTTVMALVMMIVGCKTTPCNTELRENEIYAATVLEKYSTTGRFPGPDPMTRGASCDPLEDIDIGSIIAVEKTGYEHASGASCASSTGDIVEVPGNVKVQSRVRSAFLEESALVTASGRVSIGSCVGAWIVYFFRNVQGGDLSEEPVPGQPPKVVLRRRFIPDSGDAGCSLVPLCEDYYSVRLAARMNP